MDILLGHNRWAIAQVIQRCEPLTPAQFHQRFDIGPGSLHDTITHMVGCILRWSDRIDQRTLRPSIETPDGKPAETPGVKMVPRTPEQLLLLNTQACADFAVVVARARPHLSEVRDWVFGEKSYRFNVAAAIIHVTNHGMHHRAQCMNMLKRLGRPVNADLDELEWQLAGEP